MKLPRDVSGADLVRAVAKLGYTQTRQASSHIRLTTQRDGEHHITIPAHDPIKVGTLASIIRDLCDHHKMTRDEMVTLLRSEERRVGKERRRRRSPHAYDRIRDQTHHRRHTDAD